MNIRFTLKSYNAKTGPIPVSTSSSETCPTTCPLQHGACYAKANWHLRRVWAQTDAGQFTRPWLEFLAMVRALPAGQLWRHNQAGDLPGVGDTIDRTALHELAMANTGRRGFAYTHKPPGIGDNAQAIEAANGLGFTVNLSADNLAHADRLAYWGIGPVVAVLPSTVHGNIKLTTPAGRKVVVCPATYRDDVTCASCGLCAMADRNVIVGFPAHGARAAAASTIAEGS